MHVASPISKLPDLFQVCSIAKLGEGPGDKAVCSKALV